MREIKFEIMTQDGNRNIEKAVFTIDELMDGDFPYFEIDDVVAKRQFTGLLDKNGVEIYEGDILQSYARSYLGKLISINKKMTIKQAIYRLELMNIQYARVILARN
jgi:uncharacterized phage protein (TIGR01671 family)